MKAFKLNITESGSLGTPRDQMYPQLVLMSLSLAPEGPCSHREGLWTLRKKKGLDNIIEENPSSFNNDRDSSFLEVNTKPELCGSR